MNIRSGKSNKDLQREHRVPVSNKFLNVNPAQAASPTEALGDSCCGLLRGAVQPDLRCTLGPLELTFDLCPAGQEPNSIAKRVDPGGRALTPRELRMSNQHELEQTTTVPIRRRVALSGHLSAPEHTTQPPPVVATPPVRPPTCTCLNTPG